MHKLPHPQYQVQNDQFIESGRISKLNSPKVHWATRFSFHLSYFKLAPTSNKSSNDGCLHSLLTPLTIYKPLLLLLMICKHVINCVCCCPKVSIIARRKNSNMSVRAYQKPFVVFFFFSLSKSKHHNSLPQHTYSLYPCENVENCEPNLSCAAMP